MKSLTRLSNLQVKIINVTKVKFPGTDAPAIMLRVVDKHLEATGSGTTGAAYTVPEEKFKMQLVATAGVLKPRHDKPRST